MKPIEMAFGRYRVPGEAGVYVNPDRDFGIPDDIYEQIHDLGPDESALLRGDGHIAWCRTGRTIAGEIVRVLNVYREVAV